MAAVPVTIQAMIYPRDKSGDPYPATIVGFASITGLTIGGGPILPPDQVPPIDPPLVIWGGPIDPYPDIGGPGPQPPAGAHPEHPIVLPPDQPPPVDPPTTPDHKVHEGWNFNDGSNPTYPNVGWYYVYIPGPTDAQPKKK